MFGCGERGERCEIIERFERLFALALLDFVNECDKSRSDGRRHTGLRAKRYHDSQLRIDFGWTFAHRQVAPDAAVCLCRFAIVGDEMIERTLCGANGCRGEIR